MKTGAEGTLVPPRDAQRVSSDRGELQFWEVAPHVYATHMRGYMSPDMSRLIIARADPMFGRGATVSGFHNWLDMSNYDSQCRVELTAWVLRHRTQSVLHIGVTSRMVAMGVAVANLALGNLIHVHGDLASLEAALHGVLRG